MENKSTGILIALVLVLGIGGWVYAQKQASVAPAVIDTPDTSSGLTMAVVLQHNSKASCWTVISGSVYDLTSWIPNHPGGEQNILQLCGIDGTTKFNGQHGNNMRAKTVLSGFKIGTLAH